MTALVYVHSNSEKDVRVMKEIDALLKNDIVNSVKIIFWDRDNSDDIALDVSGAKVELIKFQKKAKFGGGILKNMMSRIHFFVFLFNWLIKNKSKYDVVHVVNFELALVVLLSKMFTKNKKYVYDIFDYIIDGYGNKLPRILKRIIENLNRIIIRSFNLVIVASSSRIGQISAEKQSKIVVIENAPNYSKVPNSGKFKVNSNSKRKIVYAGVLTENRYLIEMADLISTLPNFEFYIAGYGKLSKKLQCMSKKYSNIIFLGKLDYSDVLFLENQTDIMIALYSLKIPNHKYAAPNKFYEAMFLGKPLMMVENSGMSEYVKKYKFGVTVDDSVLGLKKGMDELMTNFAEIKNNAENMKEIYERDFSWNVMSKRLCVSYIKMMKER